MTCASLEEIEALQLSQITISPKSKGPASIGSRREDFRSLETSEVCLANLLRFHHPDVAVLHLAAVALQVDRSGFRFFLPAAAGRTLAQHNLVVDQDAVVPDAQDRVGCLLAV